MELDTENPLGFQNRGEFVAMFASGSSCRTARRRGIGMREIKIGAAGNIVKEPAIAKRPHLIPTHVRQFHSLRQEIDVAMQEAEAGEFGRFGAAL